MISNQRILFIPVSSAEGIGEYMRSLIIAHAAKQRWPELDIHFILSRKAPYAHDCPFNTHLVDSSPTKETAKVNQIIQELNPSVVIFDASGRKSQLACARAVGAKVVFISQHRKKRARGMKIGRAKLTDLHLVVQPEFAIEPLSWLERLKCHCFNISRPLHVGMVFTPPEPATTALLLEKFQLAKDNYVLVNAGSGAHFIGDRLATDVFAEQATMLAQQGVKIVLVVGRNYPEEAPVHPNMVTIPSLNNDEFIALLANARAALLSGGGTMLQAIALHIPTLAFAVAKDQHERVAACANAGVIEAVTSIETIAPTLLKICSDAHNQKQRALLTKLDVRNGLEGIIRELEEILPIRV
ncbi:hypothetical protein L9G15_09175 [Shewanella sp. A3A]|nr:hypothetical protein [Shewanella ferrihydritica]